MPVSEAKERVRAWAPVIGLRAAARKFNQNEDTACSWARREGWILPAVFAQANVRKQCKQAASVAHAAMDEAIMEQGKDSRLYLSAATLKASYDAAQADGAALRSKEGSMGMLNVARTADITHGWTAERQQPVSVQVAAVIMPTPEERAERRATDAKLDAIAAELRARALPAPPAQP